MDTPMIYKKLPKYVFDICKYFGAKGSIRPSLECVHIGKGYIEATDSYKAIRVKTDIEGDFQIHKNDLLKEETEITELSPTSITLQGKGEYKIPLMQTHFPETETFYKIEGENYSIVNLGILIDSLKAIKAMGNEKVCIKIATPLSPVLITSAPTETDAPQFEVIIMPLKY